MPSTHDVSWTKENHVFRVDPNNPTKLEDSQIGISVAPNGNILLHQGRYISSLPTQPSDRDMMS